MPVATAALFTGATGSQSLTETTLTASPEGGWPTVTGRAFRDGDIVYFSYVSGDGDIMVATYDETDGTVTTVEFAAAFSVDIHDPPALAMRDDGRLVAAYCAHDGADMFVRISTNARDISAWGAATNIDSSLGLSVYTYPVLYDIGGTLYLFARQKIYPTHDWFYATSADGGATWSSATTYYSEDSAYVHLYYDGTSRVDIVAHSGLSPSTLGHVYLEGGSFYETDGTLIDSALPLGFADLTDTGVSGEPTAVCTNSGLPIILAPDVAGGTTTYRYATWNGSAWSVEDVASSPNAGNAFVYGNNAIIKPRRIYIGLESGGSGQVFLYRKDSTDTWVGRQVSTSGSDDFYPVPVFDGHRLEVIWLKGPMSDIFTFDLGIMGATVY